MLSRIVFLSTLLLAVACGGGGGGSSGPGEPQGSAPATPPAAPPASQPPPVSATTEITVLGLMSTGVNDLYVDPDLRLQHLVNVANDVLEDNGVELTFALSHVEVVDYPDTLDAIQALDDLTDATHAAFNSVAALRTSHQADLVVLFRPYANDGHCGYAWVGGYNQQGDFSNPVEAEYGYSVVAANCSDYTLLHELGHNLGLAHSRLEDPTGGTFRWAVGHGVQNDFATIMASPTEFNATQLPRLSSPGLTCNGQPCGVSHLDETDGADAVRSLNMVKDQVAAYR